MGISSPHDPMSIIHVLQNNADVVVLGDCIGGSGVGGVVSDCNGNNKAVGVVSLLPSEHTNQSKPKTKKVNDSYLRVDI
ncbi:Hypothetical predicted protein [Octopus vulgaris]|uniref:Uncharacterized protein n=1 Tax=Octopus vulgaris TaxID=6645 RepID=A0AA36FBH4_OCTVU|nr:Hypothetical predicted protein [Octopus vulgaris]